MPSSRQYYCGFRVKVQCRELEIMAVFPPSQGGPETCRLPTYPRVPWLLRYEVRRGGRPSLGILLQHVRCACPGPSKRPLQGSLTGPSQDIGDERHMGRAVLCLCACVRGARLSECAQSECTRASIGRFQLLLGPSITRDGSIHGTDLTHFASRHLLFPTTCDESAGARWPANRRAVWSGSPSQEGDARNILRARSTSQGEGT